jgi:hypothetical protein
MMNFTVLFCKSCNAILFETTVDLFEKLFSHVASENHREM